MKIKRILMIILALSIISSIISIGLAVTPPLGDEQFYLWMGTDVTAPKYIQLWTDKQVIWEMPVKNYDWTKEDSAYDGQDIVKTSLQFWYKFQEKYDGVPVGLPDWAEIQFEQKVSITDSMVKIWWNQEDLESLKYDDQDPLVTYEILNARVTGTFEDGPTFYAQGPGWTGAFRPK